MWNGLNGKPAVKGFETCVILFKFLLLTIQLLKLCFKVSLFQIELKDSEFQILGVTLLRKASQWKLFLIVSLKEEQSKHNLLRTIIYNIFMYVTETQLYDK